MVDELPLSGGFVNEVVLKDGTVRRPVGPHDAYGLDRDRRGRLVETVLWRQDRCWRGIEAQAAAGDPAMVRIRDLGAPIWIREDYRWTLDHREALEAAL
ncbi:hypothetical protein GCM10027447_33580 [Glycomyces halotolerans]